MQDMLSTAMSSQCFGGLLSHSVRAQTALISSSGEVNDHVFQVQGADGTVSTNTVPRGVTTWDVFKVIHPVKSSEARPAFQTVQPAAGPGAANPYQNLICQAQDQAPEDLHGSYVKDTHRNIVHVGYGRDRGLLKSVQFQKTDQEYLPEAQALRDAEMASL